MTLQEFLTEINNEISQDCKIPFQVPKASLMRITKQAKKWFHQHYEYAVEEGYTHIKKEQFCSESFMQRRQICLSNTNIISVFDVSRIRGNGYTGDFSVDRFIGQQVYGHTNSSLTNKDLHLTTYVAHQVMSDWVNRLFTHKITYNYNHLTKKLYIPGETPNNDIILRTYSAIADEYLFADDKFYRYVVAKAKISLARILGTVTMSLVGNAEVDFSAIKDEGKEELDEVIEEIKEQEGVDYFFEN